MAEGGGGELGMKGLNPALAEEGLGRVVYLGSGIPRR